MGWGRLKVRRKEIRYFLFVYKRAEVDYQLVIVSYQTHPQVLCEPRTI